MGSWVMADKLDQVILFISDLEKAAVLLQCESVQIVFVFFDE